MMLYQVYLRLEDRGDEGYTSLPHCVLGAGLLDLAGTEMIGVFALAVLERLKSQPVTDYQRVTLYRCAWTLRFNFGQL
jgi:hypothetical protein